MNSSENRDLQIEPAVLKIIQRMPRRDAEKIISAIKLLSFNPYYGDIQKMKGEEDVWRRRIGSYRIFYKLLVSKTFSFQKGYFSFLY